MQRQNLPIEQKASGFFPVRRFDEHAIADKLFHSPSFLKEIFQ